MRRRAHPYHFDGRVAVISGGSRGLGLLIARRLASEGARLAILARDSDELGRADADLSGRGAEVLSIPCDMRDRRDVEQAIAMIARRFGRIDVLINNAGIIQVGPLEHMRVEDFQEALAVHLYGPLYATLAALPHMRQRRAGRIVNITSIGGKMAVPHLLPYCTSKFALVGLSDGLRAELRRHGIRVTTVVPGLMRTGSPPNAYFKGHHRAEYAWFSLLDSLPLVSVAGDRAAARVVEACRDGRARLVITPQAFGAILFNELLPEPLTKLMSLFTRLVPPPKPGYSPELHLGWESRGRQPVPLTGLTEKAAVENNEMPARGAMMGG